MTVRRAAAALVLGLAAAAGGCGQRSSTPSTSTSGPPASTEASTRSAAEVADAACEAYLQVVAANGPLAVAGFDPDHPQADQLEAVGEHFRPVVEAGERQARQLRAELDGEPPGSLLAGYVEALDAENRNARDQVDAALAGDPAAFTATLGRVEQLHLARVDAARALGARRCAEQ